MKLRRIMHHRLGTALLAMAWLSWLLPAQADQDLHRLGWELSFNDEFSSGPLKAWKWNQADGPNNANQEKQWYTPDNVVVTNGNLVLVSERRNINGWEYASGKVDTAGRFDQQYGYWEVRAKLPYGQGMWPAHWMLGYQGWPPEIDIMEFRGNDPTWALFSMHWGPLPPGCAHPWECGQTQSSDYRGPDYTAGFHTFAIEWDWWGINWFVDGVQRGYSWGGIHEPMWLILNTAVGGIFGGDPDGSTPFPAYHDIDWVRVWKRFDGRSVLNGGFEDGDDDDFMNWNRYDDDFNVVRDENPVHAHSGSSAVHLFGRFNGAPNNSGLYQDVYAGEGEFVEVSAWFQPQPDDEPAGNNHADLKLEFLDGGEALIDRVSFDRVVDAGSEAGYRWAALRHPAPAGTAQARIVLDYNQEADAAGAVNVDDADIRIVGPRGDRPLLNPGFEWKSGAELPNWNRYPLAGNQVHDTTPSNIRTGSRALNISGPSTGVYQDIPAKAGEQWQASVWAKNATGNPLQGNNEALLKLEFVDSTGTILQTDSLAVADSATSQLFTTNQTILAIAPNGTATARIVLELDPDSNSPGSVIFEDADLVVLTSDSVLLNADFEIYGPDFIAWTVYDAGFNVIRDPTATHARSGANAVQMFGQFNSTDNESGIFQDVAANQGEVWEARVWARNRPADATEGENRGVLKLEFVDGGGTVLDHDEVTVVEAGSPETYQEYVIKRSAPTNTAWARIALAYVQKDFADGSVNYDDPGLRRLTVDDDRPVLNAGFEEGDAPGFVNWPRYPPGATNIVPDTVPTNVHAGSQSAHMFGQFTGGDNQTGLFQDFPAQPGEFWQANVWAQNRVGDPAQGNNHAKMKIEFVDVFDVLLATNQLTILTAASPQTYQPWVIRRQAPPGTTRARMVLEYDQVGNTDGSVNFDDAEMRVVTADDPNRPLLNGGFEVGEGAEFANWIRYGPANGVTNVLRDPVGAFALDGSVAVQMFGAFDGMALNSSGLYQDIPAQEGELWQASVWAQNRPLDGMQGNNQLWLKLEFLNDTGGNLATYPFVIVDATSPETYAWFAVRVEAPPGTAVVRIVIQYDQANSAGGSVNIDQAQLQRVAAIDESPTINGDFEDQFADGRFVNWVEDSAGSNVTTDEVPSNALSGVGAVKMFGRFDSASNASGLYQDIPAAAGQLWQASVESRNRPGDTLQGNNHALLGLTFLDADRQALVDHDIVTTDAGSPTTFIHSAVFREAPAGTAWARIVLEMVQENFQPGAVVFDDACLVPVAPLTGTNDFDQVLLAGPHRPGTGEAVVFTGGLKADPSLDLELVIGGPTPGTGYDQLRAGITAEVAGALTVTLPPGFSSQSTSSNFFVPRLGDTFDILTAASVTGTFAQATSPNGIGNLPALSVNYTTTSVFLRVERELDTDEDGLADFWELQFYGFPNASSPNSDSDMDRSSNWEEMIAGTDPTNAASFFAIDQLHVATTNVVLEWNSVSGKTYSVWYGTNLVGGTLLPAATNLPATAPHNMILLPAPSGTHRFYQLDVSDPSLMGAE